MNKPNNLKGGELSADHEESDILSQIYCKIKTSNYSWILKFIRKRDVRNYFKETCMETVPSLLSILEEEFCTEGTINCVEQILSSVANVANTKEVILVFLEEIEIFRSGKQFRVLIAPLRIVLSKEISKKAKLHTFNFVLSTLHSYIYILPLPSVNTLEGEEKELLDCDEKIISLTSNMSHLTELHRYLCEELVSGNLEWPDINSRWYFALYLVKFFDRPFTFLHIYKSKDKNGCDVPVSALYKICSNHIEMIISLIYDPFKLLHLVAANSSYEESLNITKHLKKCKDSEDDYEYDKCNEREDDGIGKNLTQLSLATFFYCIIQQKMAAELIPCVYSPIHLYLSCIPCCVHLISEKEILAAHKGLCFFESLLDSVIDGTLPSTSLNSSSHFEAMMSLVKMMIYHENAECRTLAFHCFKSFIWKFDSEGCIKLMTTILTSVNHSGIHGIVIHELKEKFTRVISNCGHEQGQTLVDQNFSGSKIKRLLNLVWSLPADERTDLLDWSDKIMAGLNLIIFLCIRDPQNLTDFKSCKGDLLQGFLVPLQEGLRLSKGHYELKLKDINNIERKIYEDANLPLQHEKEVVLSALNCLNLMQSVQARANQLIRPS